jgi:hypothetical protein
MLNLAAATQLQHHKKVNKMPCDHKFQSYLNLEKIDFEPTTLIVGTFVPEWPAGAAEWFYGRTASNYFWDVLPRLYGEASLINATPAEWKTFCHDKQIAITDLISCLDDADADNHQHVKALTNAPDQAVVYNFDDFSFVNVIQLLKRHPSIKNVYPTRGITEAFWKHAWNPVVKYCSVNNIRERKLLNPTTESDYHHNAYNTEHPDEIIGKLEDYILMRWAQEWHL